MSSKKIHRKQDTGKTSKQRPVSNTSSNKNMSFAILAAAAIILLIYCKTFDFIQDDSFITFRFVKNFTEGHGLVFNIGDRVEGYTCFLWVMLLSLIKVIGINFISASQTIGIIFSFLTIYLTYKISISFFPKNKSNFYNLTFSLISVVLLISNGAFAYWTVSGMETAMFTFLITFAVYLYILEIRGTTNGFPYSSLVFLAASLTRPEGNLIFAITVLHKIIVTVRKKLNDNDGTKKSSVSGLVSKQNVIWISVYIVPAIIFMTWRYSYYGFVFPNTFYAKTGSSLEYIKTGLDYFVEFAKTYGLYGTLILFIFINLRKSDMFYEYLYFIMIFVIYSLYVIYIGGDVLRPARFFVPILPIFYILIQEGAVALLSLNKKQLSESSTYITGLTLLVIAFISYKQPYGEIKRYSDLENGLITKMRVTGLWLKNKSVEANKPLTVAASTIGALSYYSDVTLVDMLGLTDKEISHNPKLIPEISTNTEIGWKEKHYNVDYVLSRKPDYIYFSTGMKPSVYAERGLFTSDEFLKYYYPSYFPIKELNFTDCIYKRKTDEEVKKIKAFPPNPNYQKSFVNLYNQAVNNSRDKNKTDETMNLFRQTILIAPSNFSAPYQWIGDLYLNLKNTEKAEEYYKKALEIDDYDIMAHLNLVRIYKQIGDTASEYEHLDKILKYSPDLLESN